MGFDLSAELESRVARYAEKANVTPEAAFTELLDESLCRRESPGWALIGLFSSSEDTAIMEAAEALIREGRDLETSREPIDLDANA